MRTRNDGFTLVELMVVVLIIGILVAVAVPVFKAAKASAQKSTCQANQRMIMGAIEAKNASDVPFTVTPGGGPKVFWLGAGLAEDGGTAGSWGPKTKAEGMQLVPQYLKSIPICPAREPGVDLRYPTIGYWMKASDDWSTVTGFFGDGQWQWLLGADNHFLM